jgi:DNA-binding FrmR family transcriptional regulator
MSSKETRDEHHQRSLNLIRRIQAQLQMLETGVQSDVGYEQMIIQAATIEKTMGSFTLHLLDGYLDHHTRPQLQQDMLGQDIDAVLDDLKRMIELASRG